MNIPARQLGIFRLGCWTALLAALVHLAAHVFWVNDLSPHAAAGLGLLPPDYVIRVPGLRQPAYRGVVDGLSLSLPMLLATIGAAGFAVARHGDANAGLIRGVAGAYAIGVTAVLVTSIVLFFSVQTFAIALPALCFALAAVPES